jgi:hypothetical protein
MNAYEEVIEFIASRSPLEVTAFKASEQTRRRVTELLQREKTVGLSLEEQTELDNYEALEHLMGLAKARAHQLLAHGR